MTHQQGSESGGARAAVDPVWALAIHGGAGDITITTDEEPDHLRALEGALRAGIRILTNGGSSLDAVEAVVRHMEDDERWNAGRGATLTPGGTAELDASIMSGRTLACGGAATLTTVKNPIALARAIMERSPHVLLVGAGAEQFATELDLPRVEPAYFITERQRVRWQAQQSAGEAAPVSGSHGTVGAVALDLQGNLAAATSTGGTPRKRWGRVGDSPLIGAGTYADNRSCAISCTGKGEAFIRRAIAHDVAARMVYGGHALEAAAAAAIATLDPGDGGFIAVDRSGRIAMPFNTQGMFRGAADAHGRFEIALR